MNYVAKKYPFPNNWSEKQYFIYACLTDDLQSFYRDWIEQGKSTGRMQFFDVSADGKLSHKYWVPAKICCESGSILTIKDIDVKVGYWTPFLWKPIHKDLKQQAVKFEALECQKIDKSCNDCKFLDRKESWCQSLSKAISINENLCHPQNELCFEHRRSA